jgi:ribonucleoside-diphosphate reductase alpha chain
MEAQRNMMSGNSYTAFGAMPNIKECNDKLERITRVKDADGTFLSFNVNELRASIEWAILGHEKDVSVDLIFHEVINTIFDGVSSREIADALILATATFIERDPAYNYVAAQLLLKKLFKEVTGTTIRSAAYERLYRQSFIDSIHLGVQEGGFDKRLLEFDLNTLAAALHLERDSYFEYMGLKTLNERYFHKIEGKRLELPQTFWMRIAMGVSLNEANKNEVALKFYDLLSSMRYMASTPTLLHGGMARPQLSSCFLTTVEDDLKHIFKCLGDNAQLSKWSGGVANDWSNLRACGAMIKTIRTESQGVIPFLKIANDVTAAINRSGSRRGATCVYLETWHLDYEDFLDLKRNTGDERRRTHDINTASWIPDLFMKRLLNNELWTFFSPEEVPDLHHLYGKAFDEKYVYYEQKAARGEIKKFKKIEAAALWRKMLSRLFETGHPWITFKDPANIRSPQDHAGVIHSSNLCTEIELPTSADETAVCNLGSINLAEHIVDGKLDEQMLEQTIENAMRMLDNVIDINFYPTIEAQNANFRHRPVGLGTMGLQDAFYKLDVEFSEKKASEVSDYLMESVAYYAILSSSKLAKERGAYQSYKGSKWDRNIFPQDTIALLEQERGMEIPINKKGKRDWTLVRDHVKQYGMRNSNCMAIAPTATISNIVGCFPCIEPIYKNLYVKANMSGEFTIVNKYLIQDLKKLGLWDHQMLELLKYYDGSIQMIEKIPLHIREKYKEVFEIDPEWLIEVTANRGKWIDQSQSHNVFMKGVSGKKLNDIYILAWKLGLKTTYYLRTLGASQIEKSTLDAKKFGFTQKREYTATDDSFAIKEAAPIEPIVSVSEAESAPAIIEAESAVMSSCSLSTDPECEVCQ